MKEVVPVHFGIQPERRLKNTDGSNHSEHTDTGNVKRLQVVGELKNKV